MSSPSTTIYSNGKITADLTDVVTINSGGIDIAGTLTTDDFSFSGDFSVNTDKFTVASATGNTTVAGNTAVAGTLDVTSDLNVNTDKFTVASATGNTTVAGNTAVAGTLDVTSDLNVNTDKFTVASATGNTTVAGNTAVAGTLDVTSDLNVNTDKFTVASATGNTTVAGNTAVAGDLDVTSDLNVNTDKFTVASATGNTTVAGTLDVTGNTTLTNLSINGNLDIVGTQTVINTRNINIQDKAITYGVITASVHTQIISTQNTLRIKKINGITTNSVYVDAIIGYTVTNSSVDSISLTGHSISSITDTSDYLELTLNSNITLDSGYTIDVDNNVFIFNDGYSNTNDILLKGIYLKSGTEVASFGMGVDVSSGDEVLVFHDTTVSNISSTTINSSALANLRINEIAVTGNKIRSDDTIQIKTDNDTSFLGLEGLSFSSTSDERYKKNIRIFNNAIDSILKINGYRFAWKDNNKESIGFIAQEIEKEFPELVNTNKDGYKSVEYSKFTSIIIECIKEQQNKINNQEERITLLEKQINKLLGN